MRRRTAVYTTILTCFFLFGLVIGTSINAPESVVEIPAEHIAVENTTAEEDFCKKMKGVYAGQTDHHIICESFYLGDLEKLDAFLKNAMKD